jgi:hypothetical protein
LTRSISTSDSNPSKDTVEKVAQSLAIMNDVQLLRLFSLLLEMRSQQQDRQSEKNGQPTNINSVAGDDKHVAISSSEQSDKSIKAGFIHRLACALSLFSERDFWKSSLASTFPWVIALLAAPFVVPLAFERDRTVAEPKISIEYAFLSRHSQQLPQSVAEFIKQLSQKPIYIAYSQARILSGKFTSISTFSVPGARLSAELRHQLLTEIADFRKFLVELEQEFDAQQEKLALLNNEDLKGFAFTVLDDHTTLDKSAPREFLSNSLKEKKLKANSLLVDVEKLEKAVTSSIPEVRLRLALLNRGATDGLVRHHGKLKYREEEYVILRTSSPSADFNALAVPVFQTNKQADDYAPGSVGKIEQDSMAEFWYSFKLKSGSEQNMVSLCREGEKITVTLFDHNKRDVIGHLDCNG